METKVTGEAESTIARTEITEMESRTSQIKKVQEAAIFKLKARDTKGRKKNSEVTNPNGEKDLLKVIGLDDNSTLQEIEDSDHELNIFSEEDDLSRYHERSAGSMSEEQIDTNEKAL